MSRQSSNSARQADTGSVLVEAMVAVAIIAMMLAACYRAVGDSALRSKAAEASRTATLIARSRLAALGSETPLEPGETRGLDGAFIWRVDVDETPAAQSTIGRLLRVQVVVADRAGGSERARLTSLRLSEGG